MKKRTKLLWGLFILLILIGGIIMTQKNFLTKKTTQITREQQIAYLKKHEQEMTDYIKSQNSKVTSVQWDWDSAEVDSVGNGTPQGGEKYLQVFGNANNADLDNFTVHFSLDERGMPQIESMTTTDLYRFEE